MNISDCLISLLRYELCGEESQDLLCIPKDDEIVKKIISLAESHDLGHFIYEPMKKLDLITLGSDLDKNLQKQQMLAVFRYKRIEHELKALSSLLEKEKIPFIPLKGSVIRKYYSKPWLRTSCDIDILVKESDLERTQNAISEQLGYKAEKEVGYHDISLYSPSGVHLELHFNIKESLEKIDKLLSRAWEFASPISDTSYEHSFTSEFFVFHMVAHMSYHFKNGGCGIRPFMDMHLTKKNLEYSEAELLNLCDICELREFYYSISNLTNIWFGNEEKNERAERMQTYLMYGGVYGTLENRIATLQNKRGGKVGYIISRVFSSKAGLKARYPILKKHPYLLPIYQIRRWCSLIFGGKFKKSLNEIKMNNNISNERVNQTDLLMKEIGLN